MIALIMRRRRRICRVMETRPNDKPAAGLQQKRESKPKTLSWDFTSSSPNEQIIQYMD